MVSFDIAASQAPNPGWLRVGPLYGQPGFLKRAVTVSLNPTALQPGIYRGSIVVRLRTSGRSGESTKTVPITLEVD